MALPEITAPVGTPVFLAEGHTQNDDSAFAVIDYATGHSRSRRVKKKPERVVAVRWFLEAPLVPIVREWFEETLLQASLPFAAYIRNLGPGMVYVGARWISYQWEMLHLGRAVVSGELLVEDEEAAPPVPLLSIGWMSPLADSGGTIAHANAGAATWALDAPSDWWLGVVAYDGEASPVVAWSLEWTPTGADPSPTLDQPFGTTNARARITWPTLGFNQTSEGILRVTATVGGAPTDAILGASGAANYNAMTWGPEP